ncbi:MAG: adenylate/guanylate cyclase domain-containing protein, partial [Candidatus Tumulicola sp.]
MRTLGVALLASIVAAGIAIALENFPESVFPLGNRIADLSLHVAASSSVTQWGWMHPAYEADANPNLGIVTIDDATFHSMGFPLPRSMYATLLDRLRAAGAKAVAFDIQFLEPSGDPPQDAAFAAALRQMPSALAFPLSTTAGGRIAEQRPIPSLANVAAAIGYVTVDAPGGYVIGEPPTIETQGGGTHANERLLSLPVAAVDTFAGHPVRTSTIPVDRNGRMLVLPPATAHHQDPGGSDVQTQSFAGRGMLSFADALKSTPQALRPFANGALVYVGATAAGLFDVSTTAGRGRVPGLYIVARLADQLMRGFYLRPAPAVLDAFVTLLLALLAALLVVYVRVGAAALAVFVATLAYACFNVWLFVEHLYWLDLAHVVLAVVLATLATGVYRVATESGQRRMVTQLFGMHVSPAVVGEILRHDDPADAIALRGKRVRATIFYSDIRGFTSLSETMEPEAVYAQLNEYFDAMCAIIFERGGFVDKFIGDCVMAVFSAPFQTPDDASNAVTAAIEQQREIERLNERWSAAGRPTLAVGMGINTGEVVMGNLGASSRMNYTVIGDNVNVASRLYNVAKGGEIIISESTYDECKTIVEVDALEPVAVKGKSRPIAIYNVRSLKKDAAR